MREDWELGRVYLPLEELRSYGVTEGDLARGAASEQWRAFASEHDCCLEPVLELDEALTSELVRHREMVVEIEQPGVERPVRQLGVPVKLSRTPGAPARLPGPALGEHTEAVLREAGYDESAVTELLKAGAVAGPAAAEPAVTFRA